MKISKAIAKTIMKAAEEDEEVSKDASMLIDAIKQIGATGASVTVDVYNSAYLLCESTTEVKAIKPIPFGFKTISSTGKQTFLLRYVKRAWLVGKSDEYEGGFAFSYGEKIRTTVTVRFKKMPKSISKLSVPPKE